MSTICEVNIFFNDIGKKNISNFSKDNIGALIAVIMDEKVVSAPIISSHIKDGRISIFGNLPEDQIFKMNLFLNYGSLPSELKEISNIDLASAQADARLSVLIEAGADINSIDNQGQTAMHWAGKLGSPTFLKLLIKNGGNFLIEDMYGKTALDYTKENKRWALLD